MTQSNASVIKTLKDGQFNLMHIDQLEHAQATDINNYARVDAAAVQAAIRSNPALTKALQAKQVEVNSVVAADEAANGTVTFYLR